MAREDSFGNIYDGMTQNYAKLESIMSEVYQYLQDNPTDDRAKYLMESLGTVAHNMLFSQREFTASYGDPSLKDSLVDNLDDKDNALSKALEDTKGKTR